MGLPILYRIGQDLHQGRYPRVLTGGIVSPASPGPPYTAGGVGTDGQEQRKGAEGAEAREGAATKRSPYRSRSTRATPPVLEQLEWPSAAEVTLKEATVAYPQLSWTVASTVIWLSLQVTPITGLSNSALVVGCLAPRCRPRFWAWWEEGVWIGPRHTNYGDGSICAYEPSDGTWMEGDGLVLLLDLVVVWVVRHLFLRRYGFWPGEQVLHTVYERTRENLPEELCGACVSSKTYRDCHMEDDARVPLIDAILGAGLRVNKRYPSREAVEYLQISRGQSA